MSEDEERGPLVGDCDPEKAEVGVFNRIGEPVHATPNDIETFKAKGDGDFTLSMPERDEPPERAKEASVDKEGFDPTPATEDPTESSIVETSGKPDLDKRKEQPIESDNTDLNPGGAPDVSGFVEERLDQLRSDMFGDDATVQGGNEERQIEGEDVHKEPVQEREETRERRHEDYVNEPADISIERGGPGNANDISRGDESSGRQSTRHVSGQGRGDFGTPKVASDPMESLARPSANAVRIKIVMDKAYDDAWRSWEPETILETVHKDHGVDIDQVNQHKLMALKVLSNTDRFWTDPFVFEKVAMAFNHHLIDWSIIQQPPLHELCAARALVERYIDEQDFSTDVADYVASSAVDAGFIMLPPKLRFAGQPFTDQLINNMGDEALDRQQKLHEALQNNDPDELSQEDHIQFFRMVRCNLHAQQLLDNVRS